MRVCSQYPPPRRLLPAAWLVVAVAEEKEEAEEEAAAAAKVKKEQWPNSYEDVNSFIKTGVEETILLVLSSRRLN